MVQQLSFGLEADSAATDQLFVGIFPEPPIPDHLAGYARELKSKHGLSGWPLSAERFHITLFDVGLFSGLNKGRIQDAKEAAATVRAPAFDVTFSSVMSFHHSNALVLRTASDTGPLFEFHHTLRTAIIKAGIPPKGQSFTPHITLLYDSKLVSQEPIKPLQFSVRNFTLVHSLQGKTQHIKLAQWNLQG